MTRPYGVKADYLKSIARAAPKTPGFGGDFV